jgi:predicted XRE-type DNA-binding protein
MEQNKNNKQDKKTFAKAGFLPEDAPDCHPEEMALRKQIRNKNKKLNNIDELEQKIEANPDMELNAEQKEKLAAKKVIRKEIDDIIKQIKEFQKKQAVIDAEFAAKTKDAIALAVKNAVQAVSNMVVMCTIANENPESVPEGLRDNVNAFNNDLKKALNTVEPHADFEWKSALAAFSKASLKLAEGGAADLAAAVGKNSSIDNVIVS